MGKGNRVIRPSVWSNVEIGSVDAGGGPRIEFKNELVFGIRWWLRR